MKTEISDRTGSPWCLDAGGFEPSRLKNETSQLNLQERSEDCGGECGGLCNTRSERQDDRISVILKCPTSSWLRKCC